MRLTILGANGTYPTPGRPASGMLLDHRGTTVWIDAGSGTLAAAQEHVPLDSIDALILSHRHADHCADVFGLYHIFRYGSRPRWGVPLIAPDGLADHLVTFLGGDADHDFRKVFDSRIVGDGDKVDVGEITFDFAITDHPVPTVAVRAVAQGRVLVYSSDTGPGGGVAGLAEDADVLVCEATYQGSADEKPWPHHLTAGEAGALARASRCRRLLLTHIWPALDPAQSIAEAEETFGRPVELAVPGVRLDV